jgi:hypothetical protein
VLGQVSRLVHDPMRRAVGVGLPASDEDRLAGTDPDGCDIAGNELRWVGPSRDPSSAGLPEPLVS